MTLPISFKFVELSSSFHMPISSLIRTFFTSFSKLSSAWFGHDFSLGWITFELWYFSNICCRGLNSIDARMLTCMVIAQRLWVTYLSERTDDELDVEFRVHLLSSVFEQRVSISFAGHLPSFSVELWKAKQLIQDCLPAEPVLLSPQDFSLRGLVHVSMSGNLGVVVVVLHFVFFWVRHIAIWDFWIYTSMLANQSV